MQVVSWNEEDMEFDMIGVDAAIANAFRRILLAEVTGDLTTLAQWLISLACRSPPWPSRRSTCTTTPPSFRMRCVAVLYCLGHLPLISLSLQVLAHRLGLIPLKVDPRKFEMPPQGIQTPPPSCHLFVIYFEQWRKEGLSLSQLQSTPDSCWSSTSKSSVLATGRQEELLVRRAIYTQEASLVSLT